MIGEAEIFVGIDVSKAWLDFAVHEREACWRAGNNDQGIADLVVELRAKRHMHLRCLQVHVSSPRPCLSRVGIREAYHPGSSGTP